MACGLKTRIQGFDSTYDLTMNAGGQIVATPVTESCSPFLLRAMPGQPEVAFEVKIITGGFLNTAAATYSALLPDHGGMSDPSANEWRLVVDGQGLLYTQLGVAGDPTPVIGQIIGRGPAYPVPTQPGGGGNVVTDPVEQLGEKTGRWTAGCGHFFNSFEIRQQAVNCVSAALILCPLCSYLVNVISPYSRIHTQEFVIIQG